MFENIKIGDKVILVSSNHRFENDRVCAVTAVTPKRFTANGRTFNRGDGTSYPREKFYWGSPMWRAVEAAPDDIKALFEAQLREEWESMFNAYFTPKFIGGLPTDRLRALLYIIGITELEDPSPRFVELKGMMDELNPPADPQGGK